MHIKHLYFSVFWFPFYCCLNECGSGINICDITIKMPWTKCFEHDCDSVRKRYTLRCCGNMHKAECYKVCNITDEDLIIREPCAAPRCVNGRSESGKCKCYKGYSGNCCDACPPGIYCEHGGICSMVGSNKKCYCKPGYHGDKCQYKNPTTIPTTTKTTMTTTTTPVKTTSPTTKLTITTPTTTKPTTTKPSTTQSTTKRTTTDSTTKPTTTTPATPPPTTPSTTTPTITTTVTTTPTTTQSTTTSSTTIPTTTIPTTTTKHTATTPTESTTPITKPTSTAKPIIAHATISTDMSTTTLTSTIPRTLNKPSLSMGLPIKLATPTSNNAQISTTSPATTTTSTTTKNMSNTKKTVSSITIPTPLTTSTATSVNSHSATTSTTSPTINRNPPIRSIRISQTAQKNDSDNCMDDPCLYGECIEHVDGYICVCNILFKGKHCTKMKIWAIVCISIAALAVVVTCCFFCLSCNRNLNDNKVIPLKIKPQPYISDYEDQQFNRKKRGPIRPKIWKY